jgi:hypothetical protein
LANVLKRFGEDPASAAGALGGAAVGAVVAHPVAGAAAGQAISRSLQAGHEAFFARRLAPDERRRAEILYQESKREIWQRFASGEQPADWVCTAIAGDRLASVEVLEHGLHEARDQYEERKIRHVAALLAFLFFNHELRTADVHHYMALAGRLTYRQLVLIAIFANDPAQRHFPNETLLETGWIQRRDIGLVLELAGLANEAILFHDDIHVASFQNMNLAQMRVLLQGRLLYEGMKLNSVDADSHAATMAELEAFANAFVRRQGEAT